MATSGLGTEPVGVISPRKKPVWRLIRQTEFVPERQGCLGYKTR